jgi:hypothetical protein
MDFDIQMEMQKILQSGEQLLWWGRPARGIKFRTADLFAIPFGLFFLGFSLFWENAATSSVKSPSFMTIWGLPFIAVGLYMSFGRFIFEAWWRSRQTYGLTDRRLIVKRNQRVSSSSLKSLPDLRLDTNSGGLSTINFGQPNNNNYRSNNISNLTPSFSGTSFEFLENGNAVYDQILKAQADLSGVR